MVTMAQRITQLRDEKGLSRPALAAALKLPKNAVEKFETGRQSPTKDQVQAMADFFGVSVFYLRGESGDRTRQDLWLETAPAAMKDEPPAPAPARKKPGAKSEDASGAVADAFMKNKAFQDLVRSMVLEVLRSPEGQAVIAKAVLRELDR